MLPAPRTSTLFLAALIAAVLVTLSAYWQPDTRTPMVVQVAIVFMAAALTLARFRRFRRP